MTDGFAAAAGVRSLRLDGRRLLYSPGDQAVLELNETAGRIWRALAAGRSRAVAARELTALGVSPEQAAAFVEQAATQWTADGYLTPHPLAALLGEPADRVLRLDGLAVEIRFAGVADGELDRVFGHFRGTGEGARRRRLTIVEHAGQVLFYVERRLVLAGAAAGLIAHLKAVLTKLYVEGVRDGFLAHGALLVRGDRRLLLSGEPGAGKTTLALALAAAGWRYGGDDIVHIDPRGAARGVPFAAAVKQGAEALLASQWPELEQLPVSLRPDGQEARYLIPPNRAPAEAGPLTLVARLARRPGAVARAAPISAVEALGAIMGGAYAERWRMTGGALCALARTLGKAACVELQYSELQPAVDAIETLADVQASAA